VSWRWRHPLGVALFMLAGIVALQLGEPMLARGLLLAGLLYVVLALVGPGRRR
jgi:hypothetical protein